jgi:quercetin dioxygenase-like cupin family protein
MEVIRAAEGETVERSDAAIFEGGQVWARGLAGGDTGRGQHASFGIVQFAAGARTKPHRHSSDQLLYVVAGIGKVGAGGEEQVISAGDFVLIPAGEDHWHGAADTGSPMSHITVTLHGSETTLSE